MRSTEFNFSYLTTRSRTALENTILHMISNIPLPNLMVGWQNFRVDFSVL